MNKPCMQSDLLPIDKALRDANAVAAQRLIRVAGVIEAHHLDHSRVVFSKRWCRPGRPSLLVLFAWPGVLMVIDPRTGNVLQQARASYMARAMPEATAFLQSDRKAGALLVAHHATPLGAPCKGVFDAWGGLTVRSVKTGVVLAVSQPGRPGILLPGFDVLALDELKSRLQ